MTRPGPDHDPARDPTMTQPDDNAGSMGQERGIDGSRMGSGNRSFRPLLERLRPVGTALPLCSGL